MNSISPLVIQTTASLQRILESYVRSLFSLIALPFILLSLGLFFYLIDASMISGVLFALFFFSIFGGILFYSAIYTRFTLEWTKIKNQFLEALGRGQKGQNNRDINQNYAEALENWAEILQGKELFLFSLPASFHIIAPFFASLLLSKPLLNVKKDLLETSANYQYGNIKAFPLEPSLHLTLSRTFLKLAGLYKQAPKSLKLLPTQKKRLFQLFQKYLCQAIGEMRVVANLGTCDALIWKQMAHSYRDLKDITQEKIALETALNIDPTDDEALTALGELNFKTGFIAEGLQAYEKLRTFNPEKAQLLLEGYTGSV